MIQPSGFQHALAFEDQRAVVVEVGGGLRSYSTARGDVLEGYPVEDMADAGRGQLLTPWPNRIEDGRYAWADAEHQLSLTEPGRHNAIHGLTRWASWSTLVARANTVSLGCVLHAQPGYPFTLSLRVDYVLDAGGLTVTVSATNEGDSDCPFGMGAHPYLTGGGRLIDAMELTSPAETVLVHDQRGIPQSRTSVAGTAYDFRSGRAIEDTALDHAFTDLVRDEDATACVKLADPSTGRVLELWMDEGYDHLMLFTGDPLPDDRRRRGLGVEPMTCPPNAFRTGEDVIRLAPGSTTSASWGLREQD